MATQELYIRNASDTEARGPFNVDQVAGLAEAGQVTADTLVYDATAEQWVAIKSNPELMAAVFPEKKKLTLKAKEIKTLNKTEENAKEITVNDMLAAAEGRTDDTKDKADPEIAMMRAARIGTWGIMATLVAAAAGEILPAAEVLTGGDMSTILAHPMFLFGVMDVVLVVLLGLGVTSCYPFVRFRAALGFGFLAFWFYATGDTAPMLAAAAGSAGLYLSTIFVSLVPVVVAAAAGVLGMAAIAWHFIAH